MARPPGPTLTALLRTLGLFLLSGIPAIFFAQEPDLTPVIPAPAPPPSRQKAETPAAVGKDEIIAHDEPATFKMRVNLVLVRVVVRDGNGKTVANLKKEDFQLADNLKLQTISSFAEKTTASLVMETATKTGETEAIPGAAKAVQVPQRFVALFFDDLHLGVQDVMSTRQAAANLFASLRSTDRMSIFTASGQVEQDFTSDRQKLDAALQSINPRSMTAHSATDCPPMSLYEAYMIVEGGDPLMFQVAIQDAVACGVNPRAAQAIVRDAAQRMMAIGESELQISFSNLGSLIRRMSTLPGERAIVLVSPGFFMTPSMQESSDMIDRATQANIVINTIDARGLYVSSAEADLSTKHCTLPECLSFLRQQETLQGDVLAELSDGTGGVFIHNRNDIDQGLLQATAEPEVSYVLGFSPQNLKLDGKYHQLKVTLTNRQKWTLQARHGYFAPHGQSDPKANAKDEIQQAIYSHEEVSDFPIDCETQFFKIAGTVRLSVSARIEVKGLRFRRAENRNVDQLTVATAVFDDNGNLVTGLRRVIDMKLKDATMERLKKTGISVKSDFEIKSGTYLVRLVVRDSEGLQMGAINRGVLIP